MALLAPNKVSRSLVESATVTIVHRSEFTKGKTMTILSRSPLARKVAFLALTAVCLLSVPASAQGIDLPEDTDTMISAISDSQNVCARGRLPHPWTFHAEGSYYWLIYSWEAIEGACTMELQLQTSDTAIFRFVTLEYTPNTVNCNGSTQRRVLCTLPGSQGPARVGVRMEMTGVGWGTLSVYDPSSGVNRLYDIIVGPDFLGLVPHIWR